MILDETRQSQYEDSNWGERTMRVIVASSNDSLRRSVDRSLEQLSCEIRTVSRSGDLLISVLRWDYDLVVLDMALEGMTALETLSILKRLRPKSPVIVLSADRSADLRTQALQAGALRYFVIPFDLDSLVSAARSIERETVVPGSLDRACGAPA